MKLKENENLPNSEIFVLEDGEPTKKNIEDFLRRKKVVIFGLPGAYTSVCSAKHLPGYVKMHQQYKDKGIDYIICMSVNDPFVMKAWEENSNSKNITMIADGNGNLTDSLDLAMDGSAFSLGKRCQRFAMIIQDGTIKVINTEDGPGLDRSSAESILKSI